MTAMNESSQLQILRTIPKVALLLLYVLAFAGVTLLAFERVNVMVALAVAIASMVGGCGLAGYIFGTTKPVQLLAARIMGWTILPVLVVFVYSVQIGQNTSLDTSLLKSKEQSLKSSTKP